MSRDTGRVAALVFLTALGWGTAPLPAAVRGLGVRALEAQEIHGPLSPAGRLRLQVAPTFLSWDSRFGERTEDGGTVAEVEPLGFDLTGASGVNLFPRIGALETSLQGLLDDPAFEATLGRTRAQVSASQVRVPLRADLGITDWLTVGVTVPLVKSRTEIALSFDTVSANLGLSPALLSPGEVGAFTSALSSRRDDVRARATELCGADATSAACLDATALAEEGDRLLDGFVSAYGASPFFPLSGSTAAETLGARVTAFDEGLSALGLSRLGRQPVFATGPLTPALLGNLLARPDGGFNTLGLTDRVGLWEVGDVEVHAAVRLIERGARLPLDSAGGGGLRYLVGVGALVRLPTGTQDDPDLFFEIPAGDAQTDFEGRAFVNLQAGRLGLWTDARLGVQGPTTVTRRIAPPDLVLVPALNRAEVEWTPGSYLQLEIVPRLHFTEELAFTLGYRFFAKGADEYTRVSTTDGEAVEPPFYTDASLLGLETEERVHELGFGLVFTTVETWRQGRTGFPFDVWFGWRGAVAGGGGRTPKAGRATVGLRLYRGLWGGG